MPEHVSIRDYEAIHIVITHVAFMSFVTVLMNLLNSRAQGQTKPKGRTWQKLFSVAVAFHISFISVLLFLSTVLTYPS